METVSGKLENLREDAERAAPTAAQPAAQVVKFPAPKKPRGRPRKLAKTPSTDDFDIVCAAIRGIPKGKRLAAAKGEARRVVAADKRSSASGVGLYDRIMDAINHTEGKDWHSVAWYAKPEQLGKPKRTIERAYRELVGNGHLLRRRVKAVTGGWDISETTSPTLARAGNATVVLTSDVGTDENCGTPPDEKGDGSRHENAEGTDKQCTGYRLENTEGTDENAGLTSKKNLSYNLQGNLEVKSARASAREGDFKNTILADAATSQVEPRFDTSPPLTDRIDPEDPALARFAKGWPMAKLRDEFCAWLAATRGTMPRNAQMAFLAWLTKTHATRPVALPSTPEGQLAEIEARAAREGWERGRMAREIAKQWAAEDKLDAPVRAPFEPIKDRLPVMRLAQWNALMLRKLRGRA